MQYKVPQNVQREDTIIGPVTIRQMIILLIGGAITYATYISMTASYVVATWLWLPLVGIMSSITLAFAFFKIHNMEFHKYLMSLSEYHILPKKRTWIQASHRPYISILEKLKHSKKAKITTNTKKKEEKSLSELSKLLDSHGEKNIQTNKK
ncbi:PrgI family protein [Candidatus Gracilibacteria bacterium]|nr:PrgI family protein [Candidatus Gracilibacteria bacterium]